MSIEPEPDQRVFDVDTRGNHLYEIEISAWPYHGYRSEDVISRSLVYRLKADDFRDAVRIADVLRQTVQAVHFVWTAKVVRVGEAQP